jgi:cyclomaltodextrinase / maltogenic alpha-amylase / neopullulanase
MTNIKLSIFIIISTLFTLSAQNFSPPEWSYNKSIYEVNVRQFTEEGTFNAFSRHLPRLKEMGVGIIWLMPVHPIGEVNRKGTLGSYYSVKDYWGINPEFGNKTDFRNLVNEIHSLGMFVILDWVANHTAWDNPWISEHPGWYTRNELGRIVSPVDDWTDVADLNFENKEVWSAMTEALKYWVDEFDIDGYRCDVAGMVPTEFWIQARTELEKIKPVFMLAEWDTPELHRAFDMTYSWDHHKLMNSIAAGEANAKDMREFFEKENKEYSKKDFRMRFTDNHDENSWNGTVFERLGESAEMFAVFKSVIPGMPLVYSGQEAGLNKRLEFFEKDLIEWEKHPFFGIYKKLLNHKKRNKALLNGDKGGELEYIEVNYPEEIFAFSREMKDDKILGIFNFSSNSVNVNISGENIRGKYRNLFNDSMVDFSSNAAFVLPAYGYLVLTNR